jgi:5-methylcytosine-specific restriction endonuclease McrA
MRKYREYSDNDIINYSKEVFSLAGLMRKLDLRPCGGNYASIKRKVQTLNIDTSHWTGSAWSKDKQLKDWSQYTKAVNLKKHLIIERGHKCEKCGNTEWFGQPIALEVHHIDGDRTNNSLENLQLLCPNCHATTPNWRKQKL